MEKPQLEKLLTTEQAADLLGVATWTLRQWTHERRVPFVKLGKLVKFSPRDLAGWVESQKVEPEDHENKLPALKARAGMRVAKRWSIADGK